VAGSEKVGGRIYYLGTYDTPEKAARIAHLWRLANLPSYTGRNIAACSQLPRSAT
jgi:hypothetical protein